MAEARLSGAEVKLGVALLLVMEAPSPTPSTSPWFCMLYCVSCLACGTQLSTRHNHAQQAPSEAYTGTMNRQDRK